MKSLAENVTVFTSVKPAEPWRNASVNTKRSEEA